MTKFVLTGLQVLICRGLNTKSKNGSTATNYFRRFTYVRNNGEVPHKFAQHNSYNKGAKNECTELHRMNSPPLLVPASVRVNMVSR